MSRPFPISTPVRWLSKQPYRPFSTVRPALRLSASSVGDFASRRATVPVTAGDCRPSAPKSSLARTLIRQPCASFSASSIRPATQVTQNPRTGDDGETLMISISPRAVERLREITDPTSSPSATKDENPYNHLRITVTSGGCHGFQYMMSLESAEKIDAEEDTVFEGDMDGAEPAAGAGEEAKVVMDEPSLELLSGSTVDYTTELIGSQFKIVDNPRATSNCGCGTSFDVMD
ncbi:FeS cluster insertion protein [Penicillium maclennaniae]|uniref:FeS cluster insertion protein n=1 Tax=Penicillium maclennaniae TaxID=1343394 RepID=UPI002541A018|nr:FeS cluster insertion protein [Penicillium maclennaniae]KAJ5666221.1 FeS cluster insertion protein [Penicillium maclennaniae]